jgi:exonuclease SbcC
VRIGSLRRKLEETLEKEAGIKALQSRANELAGSAVIYEELKAAFSQDGIPHSIVRSVVPLLAAKANAILGQMTGGRMGLEFVMDKVLKSAKKEVAALDIFIEEYGKGKLPYLSKSGGEKVKAALSAILALAEIKAARSGIQLGMLFIDEPPFLDADGMQAYCDALEAIQRRYGAIKIMAITHDPAMKARFPQSVDVVKTERGSKVMAA